MNFTQQDLEQLSARGISVQKAEEQLKCFQTGFPVLDIVEPAALHKGVISPSAAERK